MLIGTFDRQSYSRAMSFRVFPNYRDGGEHTGEPGEGVAFEEYQLLRSEAGRSPLRGDDQKRLLCEGTDLFLDLAGSQRCTGELTLNMTALTVESALTLAMMPAKRFR